MYLFTNQFYLYQENLNKLQIAFLSSLYLIYILFTKYQIILFFRQVTFTTFSEIFLWFLKGKKRKVFGTFLLKIAIYNYSYLYIFLSFRKQVNLIDEQLTKCHCSTTCRPGFLRCPLACHPHKGDGCRCRSKRLLHTEKRSKHHR